MEDLSKQSIFSKISIKDILIGVLVLMLLGMTFCGSPIDRKKSEIKELHKQNDSLLLDAKNREKRVKELEEQKSIYEQREKELNDTILILNQNIINIENEKKNKPNTIKPLSADGVVDFFTKHLNTTTTK